MEVYLRAWPSLGSKVQVSQNGGTEPTWSRDGKELFYRSGGGTEPKMAAAVVVDGRVQSRTELFSVGRYEFSTPHRNYDVFPDGRSFVMVRQGTPGQQAEVVYLQNLPGLMARRKSRWPAQAGARLMSLKRHCPAVIQDPVSRAESRSHESGSGPRMTQPDRSILPDRASPPHRRPRRPLPPREGARCRAAWPPCTWPQDLKHNRQVAVKVLRPELAAVIGAERFLSEITTTANLQHPHILPLFDSGEADGFLFYVMPLRRRRDGPRPDEPGKAAPGGRRGADRERGGVRPGLRPPPQRDPPRHQAGEHPAPRRLGPGGRLRHRARRQQGRRHPDDRNRHVARHAALHEPRAGDGRARDHRAQRCVRAGLRALRDARRGAAVHGSHRAGHHRAGASPRLRRSLTVQRHTDPAAGRGGRAYRTREAPGRPFRHGRRVRGGVGAAPRTPRWRTTATAAARGPAPRPTRLQLAGWAIAAVASAAALFGLAAPDAAAPDPALRDGAPRGAAAQQSARHPHRPLAGRPSPRLYRSRPGGVAALAPEPRPVHRRADPRHRWRRRPVLFSRRSAGRLHDSGQRGDQGRQPLRCPADPDRRQRPRRRRRRLGWRRVHLFRRAHRRRHHRPRPGPRHRRRPRAGDDRRYCPRAGGPLLAPGAPGRARRALYHPETERARGERGGRLRHHDWPIPHSRPRTERALRDARLPHLRDRER